MAALSPAEHRIRANASGSEEQVLGFLRGFPVVPAWEYSAALGPETETLTEPVKCRIRNVWFNHLEFRDDVSRRSTYFDNANVEINSAWGLVFDVFEVALKQAPRVARDLLRRNNAKLSPRNPRGYKIDGTTLHYAARHGSPDVLNDLLNIIGFSSAQEREELISTRDASNRTVLVIAVEECDLESVKVLIGIQPTLLDVKRGIAEETPLHTAIKLGAEQNPDVSRILEIIKAVVERRPATLWAHNKDGDPPYYCARKLQHATPEVRKQLSDRLMEYIVKYLKSDIRKARRALYGQSVRKQPISANPMLTAFRYYQDKELGLNFSDFNEPSHDFSQFIRDIWKNRGAMKDLQFEPTLFYVVLPDFYHHDNTQFHDEVETLFKWLEEFQEVTSIVDLVIPDSFQKPMEDNFIQLKILDKFYVTSLNWRKMDINMEILTESVKTKKSLRQVQLYSSGNWSILHHWASDDGLRKIKTDNVRIRIIQPKLTRDRPPYYPSRLQSYRDNADAAFKAAHVACVIDIGDFDVATVNIHSQDSHHLAGLGLSGDYKDCHDVLEAIQDETSIFSDNFKNHPVKVAVIDNGADKVRTTFSDRIKEGISYVTSTDGKYELPWWHVTDPHGAQMASIICEINPHCHLYIARVGTERNDVNLDSAAMVGILLLPSLDLLVAANPCQAIDWAIAREVDIISISWATEKNHPDLRDAVGRAFAKDIVVICSTADEGELASEVFPARWGRALTVSALNAAGRRRGKSQKDVDVLVLGEDVPVMGPDYIRDKSKEDVSGSSVATAVTAGIASLLLVCTRIVNRKQEYWEYFRRPDEMRKLFKCMHTEKNKIKPAILFGEPFKKGRNFWARDFVHPEERWIAELVTTGHAPARYVAAGSVTEDMESQPALDHEDISSSRSTTWYSTVSDQISVR